MALAKAGSHSKPMEEAKTQTQPTATPSSAPAAAPRRAGSATSARATGASRSGGSAPRRGNGPRRDSRGGEREKKEFDQKILDLSRVTRVTAGGKRMSFRAALVIGDRKGRVGFGVAKGADVQMAIEKSYRQAKKRLIRIPLSKDTIPHPTWSKFGSAVIMIKPAPRGTGLKCGGAVRVVFEMAGVPNAVSKIVNSTNKINIAKAALKAIQQLRAPRPERAASGEAAPAAPDASGAPEEKKAAIKPKA